MDKYFIDETTQKYIGTQAEDRLSVTSDLQYLGENGITAVSPERWQQAQRYERRTWLELNSGASDDRNCEHAERFGEYEALKGKSFNCAIELGCGMFTNARLILPLIKARELHLLDPLLAKYIDLPGCAYPDIAQMTRTTFTVSSIEDYQAVYTFDLVIMINVLEHCQDAQKVFDKILEITAPGGTFVFSEPVWPIEAIQDKALNEYDAGHPLRVSNQFVVDFLMENFNPVYVHDFYGLYEQAERQDIYFIGRRK